MADVSTTAPKHTGAVKTIAIVGAGHNGLTCAAYLSQAGFAVNVYEKRDALGGLCVTERPFKKAPEIKVSSVASYFGMLRGEVVKELELEEHGLKPYLTDPIEIVLLDNGQYVFTPRDGSEAKNKVEGLDQKEKEGWQNFWQDIQKGASIVYPHYLKPGLTQAQFVLLLQDAGLETLANHVFDGSLFDLLSHYVSNDNLKAVAATCTPGFASNAGSVFGCIHHGTASTCDEFGAWGQVFGGMGEITAALVDVSLQNGARLHVESAVQSVLLNDDEVSGLKFEDGNTEQFDIVICAADPYILFEKLLPEQAKPNQAKTYQAEPNQANPNDAKTDQAKPDQARFAEIKKHLTANRPKVSAAKLHFLLNDLPVFQTLAEIGHNHKGVIVIAPSIEAVARAAIDVPQGKMPDRLMLTMAFPTLEDPSMVGSEGQPDPRHVLTVDVHYLPARLGGEAWTVADDQALLKATIETIEGQCPTFRDHILETFVVSPRALAQQYNLASLSCWHLPMTSEHLFEKRSLPGCDHYETPIKNLYLCSAGTYPGGNVTSTPGHNLAKKLISKYGTNTQAGVPQLQAQTGNR